MKQLRHFIQRINCPTRRRLKVVLAILLLCLLGRSLPYLAPIHAQALVQDQLAVEFTDRNGLALGSLLTRDQEHTAVVPLNQISPHFIQAILAAEDQRFYQHGALDLKAIARSIFSAIHTKKITSGASTITMQLARMIHPVPRTLFGKVQEIWLSWRLAAGMTKDQILFAYINRLPMGGNIYGVEAAAQTYFAIPAADLNLAQASILAALPNDPSRLNPYTTDLINPVFSPLKQRQRYVLSRMVKNGYISRSQADRASNTKFLFQPRQQGIIAAPHFLFWLANQLPPQHPVQISTTIDRPLQQFVEAQVKQVVRTLAANNVRQAAALVIDNHTGEILAYVGSRDYFSEAELGRNDGVQALRQPGSTLKPFLYQLALENRLIRPNTILADVPTHYPIPGAKLYSPTDYHETFLGPVRVRVALANSLNVPAVRLLEKVGVQKFLNRLHQLGFAHLTHPPEHYGLGLILGSGEVSLYELARAYVTLARQGQFTLLVTTFPETPYRRSTATSPRSNATPISHYRQSTWSLITNILSDAHARATGFGVDSVLALPFPTAVKTGTSSDFRDTWTVGFSTDYTVATWVGNFNGEPMQQVSGVTGAALLWNRIMLHLHEHQEPLAFPLPENMLQKPICAISGLRPTPACPTIVQEYFYLEDISEYNRQLDTFYQTASPESLGQSNGSQPLPSRLNLPPEYDEWIEKQGQAVTSNDLKILSPLNGDVFLLNNNKISNSKLEILPQLEFKLAIVPKQPVEWRLNGQKLATRSSNSLFWSLSPGNWTLQVRQGQKTDQVSFQVQLANQSIRPGFSLKTSNIK